MTRPPSSPPRHGRGSAPSGSPRRETKRELREHKAELQRLQSSLMGVSLEFRTAFDSSQMSDLGEERVAEAKSRLPALSSAVKELKRKVKAEEDYIAYVEDALELSAAELDAATAAAMQQYEEGGVQSE